MHNTIVHVRVKPDCIDAFTEACRLNHEASVQEPSNCRFDVMQFVEDGTRFVLYEAYATAEGALAHKQTAHYLQWRDTVASMMAEPRRGDQYTGIYPAA